MADKFTILPKLFLLLLNLSKHKTLIKLSWLRLKTSNYRILYRTYSKLRVSEFHIAENECTWWQSFLFLKILPKSFSNNPTVYFTSKSSILHYRKKYKNRNKKQKKTLSILHSESTLQQIVIKIIISKLTFALKRCF